MAELAHMFELAIRKKFSELHEGEEITRLEIQYALKEAMRRCFPEWFGN